MFWLCIGCQKIKIESHIGPWSIANWVISQAFNPDFDIGDLQPYLAEHVLEELSTFKKETPSLHPLHLLSLTAQADQQWKGRFLYTQAGWNTWFDFILEFNQEEQQWQITQLPNFDQYKELTQFINPLSLPQLDLNYKKWGGGLVGFDSSGRPLAEISIVWTSHFLFVNGVPLSWGEVPTDDQIQSLITELESGFKLRSQMARSTQANYTPQVALILESNQKSTDVEHLVSWCEKAGTQAISLVVLDLDDMPTLFPLAQRVPQLSLTTDQHFLHATLTQEDLVFQNQETASKRPKGPKQNWTLHDLNSEDLDDDDLIEKKINWFASYFCKSNRKKSRSGLLFYPNPSSSYQTLMTAISLVRQVEDDLPITLVSPLPSTSKKDH
jgi:hypothetical protein